MLPREHFFIGLIVGFGLAFITPWYYVLVVMFANFFIDTDHYIASCIRLKRVLSLKESFKYHDNKTKRYLQHKKIPEDMHLFHTIEYHLIVLLLSLIHIVFFYIFLGMLIHSITDYISLHRKKMKDRRFYSFILWLKKCI